MKRLKTDENKKNEIQKEGTTQTDNPTQLVIPLGNNNNNQNTSSSSSSSNHLTPDSVYQLIVRSSNNPMRLPSSGFEPHPNFNTYFSQFSNSNNLLNHLHNFVENPQVGMSKLMIECYFLLLKTKRSSIYLTSNFDWLFSHLQKDNIIESEDRVGSFVAAWENCKDQTNMEYFKPRLCDDKGFALLHVSDKNNNNGNCESVLVSVTKQGEGKRNIQLFDPNKTETSIDEEQIALILQFILKAQEKKETRAKKGNQIKVAANQNKVAGSSTSVAAASGSDKPTNDTTPFEVSRVKLDEVLVLPDTSSPVSNTSVFATAYAWYYCYDNNENFPSGREIPSNPSKSVDLVIIYPLRRFSSNLDQYFNRFWSLRKSKIDFSYSHSVNIGPFELLLLALERSRRGERF